MKMYERNNINNINIDDDVDVEINNFIDDIGTCRECGGTCRECGGSERPYGLSLKFEPTKEFIREGSYESSLMDRREEGVVTLLKGKKVCATGTYWRVWHNGASPIMQWGEPRHERFARLALWG